MLAFTVLLLLVGIAQLGGESSSRGQRARADTGPAPSNPPGGCAAPTERLDPAAWGDDHLEEPLPEFIEGGECLFCHRLDVGDTWSKDDPHAHTIRDVDRDSPEMAALARDAQTSPLVDEVELVLGGQRHRRFLRRGQGYGRLDLLSASASRGRGGRFRLADADNPHWEDETFAGHCAGCHTTGVDPNSAAFSLVSLDCYVCHGDTTLDHTSEPTLVHLAAERDDPPRVVVSICGQCHIRFGHSQATGRPYPTNFVAGDNLFRDYRFDFALADDEAINPADRHVLINVRDVVLYGREELSCTSCHEVHGNSTARHRELADRAICFVCHEPDEPKRVHKTYEVHSERCRY